MRDLGLITSNPTKVRILELLKKRGKADSKTIAKFTRIPEVTLRGVIEELKRDGFIAEEDGEFRLSSAGLDVLMKMRL